MKAKKQGSSKLVCAVSEFAGSLVGGAVIAGKKIGDRVKESTARGQGPSGQGAGKPKRVRSKTKRAAAVKKSTTAKKKKTAPGQPSPARTTIEATGAKRTVGSETHSESGSSSSVAQVRTSKEKTGKPSTSAGSA